MFEVVFLCALAIAWIIVAIIQDLRVREVANWVNFSLIIFALGFRFFWSLFESNNFSFFYQGLIGLGIFFVVGNLLYYGKVFAGGDAKLMIALGSILPFYGTLGDNAGIFVLFILSFLISGAIYGLVSSFVIAFRNKNEFNREFRKQFNERKRIIYFFLVAGILILASGFYLKILFLFGIFAFIFPYLYLFAKSVDEACMVKLISSEKLSVGDWLYKDIVVSGKKVKASWDGLSEKEISFIRKGRKKVLIRTGIPFTPVFLIAFIVLIYVTFR